MLVLSRKSGEEVIIGDNIRLTVVAIRGHQVRIGVTAPPGVSIKREELCHKPEDARTSADRPETLKGGA
jgi:carbon storage regulator